MSKDIRSFFTTVNKKTSQSTSTLTTKKRPAVISDSSDEEVPATPVEKSKTKKRKLTASNGSESEISPKAKKETTKKNDKKSSPSKLKPISALDMFKSSPKPRKNDMKKEKKQVEKETTEDDVFSDDDFKETLLQVDEIEKSNKKLINSIKKNNISDNEEIKLSTSKGNNKLESKKTDVQIKSDKQNSKDKKIHSNNIKSPRKQREDDSKKDKKSVKKETTVDDVFSDEDFKETLKQADELEKSNKKIINSIKKKSNSDSEEINSPKIKSKDDKIKSPKIPKLKNESKAMNGSKLDSLGASSDDQKYSSTNDDSICDTSQDIIPSTPKPKKRKLDHDETITDEERHERRRQSAVLYQKYLHRSGPSNPGSKEVPKGTPNCLKGLVFLITGVLDSLERDEAASIITDLGGRVVKAISGKVTHLVVGDDAGPAKLDKAKSLGLKILSEDGLLELIRERSTDSTKSNSKVTETKETKFKNPELLNKQLPRTHNIRDDEKPSGSGSPPPKKKLIEFPKDKTTKKISPVKLKEGEEVSTFFKKDKLKLEKTKEIEKIDLKDKSKLEKTKKVEKIEHIKDHSKLENTEETKEIEKIESNSDSISENVSWVDKYKPKTLKQIIGQQGDNSNVKKLIKWMENWYKNRNPNLKLTKPSPWAKNDDGAYFKAVLLSGPPGVGKTTTANLVSRELGFDVVELNASDTRNKNLLREDVGNLLSNQSLAGYFNGSEKGMTKKHVLLMDEVDGMAGNEDRGGMQELIQLIKNSSIPIICMCNDRNHPKIRSLVNYCFDLKFSKPRVEQIRAAMLSVCYKENIKIKPEVLDQIINGTQNDIRQTLNNLSMWVDDNISLETAKHKAENSRKDIKLGPWDVIRKVFSEEEQKKMNIHQKSSLFFHDYSIAPLFVQENYLSVIPHCDKKEWLDRFTESAEYLSLSDLTDKRIRSNGAWSLLPLQAIYSSVAPGHLLAGHFGGQINFPSWLGKNSKRNKFLRMLSELQIHSRLVTSGSLQAINLDYLPYIKNSLIKPLQAGNVDEAVQFMQNYHLLREDLENIVELSLWPKQKDPLALVNGKVKAAFTRQFNKECKLVSSTATKKRANVPLDQENDEYGEENEDKINSEDENEDDDITKDNTIKAKKVVKPEKAESSSKKKKTDTIEKQKKSRVSKKK